MTTPPALPPARLPARPAASPPALASALLPVPGPGTAPRLAKSPFERLRGLLAGIPPGAPPIDLAVGSPRFAPPAFVADVIARHAADWGGYPPIGGTANFRRAVHDWLDRRYHLAGWFRDAGDVLPLSGSREGLFLAAVTARDLAGKANPAILFANPFYQAYPAAAVGVGAEPVPVAASGIGITPDWSAIPEETLDRAVACYVGSPSNPAGQVATKAEWHAMFDRAERHDFLLFADECYSELWRASVSPTVGALEAARERPGALDRLVVFNSLSKRSNLAGLRVGFVAAGHRVLRAIRDVRDQAAPQVPIALQEAAAAAFDDEAHVEANRRGYDANFAAAEAALGGLFGPVTPPGGFCLWLAVGDDLALTADLWRVAGVRVLPGRFLGADMATGNPGEGRIRVALVADEATTREGLARMVPVLARAVGHRDGLRSAAG